jgi:hypothetical protein
MAPTNSRQRSSRSGSTAQMARRARGPAITAGTTAAGIAGGVLIGRAKRQPGRWGRRNSLGDLARQLGRAGKSAGELAVEVRRIREQANEPKRQSPIEVVLGSLTSRRLPRH